jgi:hypothetical protein
MTRNAIRPEPLDYTWRHDPETRRLFLWGTDFTRDLVDVGVFVERAAIPAHLIDAVVYSGDDEGTVIIRHRPLRVLLQRWGFALDGGHDE